MLFRFITRSTKCTWAQAQVVVTWDFVGRTVVRNSTALSAKCTLIMCNISFACPSWRVISCLTRAATPNCSHLSGPRFDGRGTTINSGLNKALGAQFLSDFSSPEELSLASESLSPLRKNSISMSGMQSVAPYSSLIYQTVSVMNLSIKCCSWTWWQPMSRVWLSVGCHPILHTSIASAICISSTVILEAIQVADPIWGLIPGWQIEVCNKSSSTSFRVRATQSIYQHCSLDPAQHRILTLVELYIIYVQGGRIHCLGALG